jgi:alpha-1,3-glucosyltransferase
MLKLYMRSTVLASEYLVYIPAMVSLVRRLSRLEGISKWESYISLSALLMLPSVMLIDHGHFQYNTVMLGFTAASIASLLADRLGLACFFFVSALGFKQMALFYAPAIFAYLLGQCVFPRIDILRFLGIAFATLFSFAMLFAPLLVSAAYDAYHGLRIEGYTEPPLLSSLPLPFKVDPTNIAHVPLIILAQSIHRIFPFARGLFEDKVANFWCALHTFHKLHQYPSSLVSKAALAGTLLAILPPSLILFLKPRSFLLPLGLATCAWGFFLFSYQVHEKNVLLPLLPMSLLLATRSGLSSKSERSTRAWVGFANALGAWTMFPLLKRDGLKVPYFVLVGLWQWLLGLPPTSWPVLRTAQGVSWFETALHDGFYVLMCAWHIVEAVVEPPNGKPDLWVVVNVLIGAAGFGLCYLWCLWGLFRRSGLLKYDDEKLTEKKTQ